MDRAAAGRSVAGTSDIGGGSCSCASSNGGVISVLKPPARGQDWPSRPGSEVCRLGQDRDLEIFYEYDITFFRSRAPQRDGVSRWVGGEAALLRVPVVLRNGGPCGPGQRLVRGLPTLRDTQRAVQAVRRHVQRRQEGWALSCVVRAQTGGLLDSCWWPATGLACYGSRTVAGKFLLIAVVD